jgi:hypothetical protein
MPKEKKLEAKIKELGKENQKLRECLFLERECSYKRYSLFRSQIYRLNEVMKDNNIDELIDIYGKDLKEMCEISKFKREV